jgi:hypothetical protein
MKLSRQWCPRSSDISYAQSALLFHPACRYIADIETGDRQMVNTDRAFISLGIAQIEQAVRHLKTLDQTPQIAEMIATYEAQAAKTKAWYGIRTVKALA